MFTISRLVSLNTNGFGLFFHALVSVSILLAVCWLTASRMLTETLKELDNLPQTYEDNHNSDQYHHGFDGEFLR